jgi:predicted PurR-regulated permease PerM
MVKYPFYIKSTVVLFGLILFVYALSNLREVMVPLAFSLLLAILLNPVANWLEGKKMPQVVSIIFSMLLAFIVIGAILYFISFQIESFKTELPLLKKKFIELFNHSQQTIQHSFGVSIQQQQQYIDNAKAALKPFIGATIGTIFGSLAIVVLLPVYTFLFLFYKKLMLNFLFEVFADKNSKEVGVVLQQTKGAIQNYMVGLLLEGLAVAILNSVALMLLGLKYAILLGVLGAIVNVLPYLGGILAILFPVIIATVTKEGYHTQLGILISYIIIQFIDNHFLIPVIVSSRVKINALISIVIVLLGGILWGIPGMFLSIPFIGVLKIVFDRIPELQAWGKLLGDEVPTRHKGEKIVKRSKIA